MAIVNPMTVRAAGSAISSALAPLAKSVSSQISRHSAVFRNVNPASAAKALSGNPRMSAAMQNVMPRVRRMMDLMRNNPSFKKLCEQAENYVREHGLSHINSARDEQKKEFRKTLFPPGVHSLSREIFSGNTSSISAMVGQQRWHAIQVAGESHRVTQTEWSGPDKRGFQRCKTWEPAQQKTWDWIRNSNGHMLAMDAGKPLEGGIRQHQAFLYPAAGGQPVPRTLYTDADGNIMPTPGRAGTNGQHGESAVIKRQEARPAVIEEIDDDVPAQQTKPKQIEPPPSFSQELVRRPPAAGGRAS
ncbi:hypothetical protein [Herbaspirillum sp. SJZ099]|uniref:hypothetical protein n=1 Tax=Herbaspirillum sp. SJZ099 TaxID=2572916 RepID=UPI0011A80A2E|nr:hypothetical protein [Herbaspirillum sp. SJZ099]